MKLIEIIRQHALAAAIGADWSGVATTVKALNLRSEVRTCSSVETAVALAAVGVNWSAVMSLIDGDVLGRFLLGKLASEGVAWGDPLAVPYLRSKQGTVLTQAGVDALIELSAPLLFSTVTAEQCRVAWDTSLAETAERQAAAIRSARVASIESIDAAAIVDQSTNLDAAVSAIRSHLLAFGGW